MASFPRGVRLENFPLGMRFLPSDEVKIAYLLYKVNGKPMPCDKFHVIRTVDIYGDEEPWEIFKESENLENYRYFFTRLKKVFGEKIHRRVGNGVWEALDGEVSICHGGEVIGISKRFKYRSETNIDGKWILHEYSLDGKFKCLVKPEYTDYRFCFFMKILEDDSKPPSSIYDWNLEDSGGQLGRFWGQLCR